MDISQVSVTNAITALGALGTASFGLVDSTKAAWGGISNIGMGDIKGVLRPLFGNNASPQDRSTPLTLASVTDNLRANWINGTNLDDQKANAKALIKSCLSPATAPALAAATGIDPAQLNNIASKIGNAETLLAAEAAALGRFDIALTAVFDQAYQRADQRYRNSAKLLACIFSILIALIAGFLYSHPGNENVISKFVEYMHHSVAWTAILAGALATPIAPIAKDLTSAIAAGTDVVQKLRKG